MKKIFFYLGALLLIVPAAVGEQNAERNFLMSEEQEVIKYVMIGPAIADIEIIYESTCVVGFWPILVLCIEIKDTEPMKCSFLPLNNYVDLNEFYCSGYISPLFVRLILTVK